MCELRAAWTAGDTCQIYSKSKGKWLNGQISKIFFDEEGEWLEVRYASKRKQIQRFCKDIRPMQTSLAEQLAIALNRRNTNFRRNAPPFSRARKLRPSTFTYPATKSQHQKRRGRGWKMEDINENLRSKKVDVSADVQISLRRRDQKHQKHQTSECCQDLASMTPRQIKEFLRSLGSAYEPYVRTFRRMHGNQLLKLSEDRLQEMVPIKLHRHRLMLEFARRSAQSSAVVSSVSAVEVLNWSASQVRDWIGESVVRPYATLFAKHGVDGLLLFELDVEDLGTIGVKESHRKCVLDVISALEKATFPDFKKGATDNKQEKAENAIAKHKRETDKVEGETGVTVEDPNSRKCSKRLASVSALCAIQSESEMGVTSMTPRAL